MWLPGTYTRVVDGGSTCEFEASRVGRLVSSPPQFRQRLSRQVATQSVHQVHS